MSMHNHIFISVLKGSSNLSLALQFQTRVVYCHITKSYMCLYNNSLKLQTPHGLYFYHQFYLNNPAPRWQTCT